MEMEVVMAKKAARAKREKLTAEQIELGAKYLAMSNMCMFDIRGPRKAMTSLLALMSAVDLAVDDAISAGIEGYSMDAGKGYDDRFESRASSDVEKEIKSFRSDLKAGGKRAAYWLETFHKEIPFLFVLCELCKSKFPEPNSVYCAACRASDYERAKNLQLAEASNG